jgi:hypothetical protein
MTGRTLFEIEGPKTQSIEAVKTLLAFVGRGCDPLPSEISLENGRLMLILSNKKDVYYVTTAKACSCPSAMYRPGKSCKHQRKYFPQLKKTQEEIEAEIDAELASYKGPSRLARPKEESLLSGSFKPIQPEYAEPRPAKASASSLVSEMAIDAIFPTTTAEEVEYWQQKEKAEVA